MKAGLIRTTRYEQWLSNIVLVIKKNGQVRIYIDFHNLNIAIPKDDYVMLIADMLVDVAASNGILSFMNGYFGCNQIYLPEEELHKTTFCCPGAISVFEWVIMPFGHKITGATYQRAMNLIFHDLIGKYMKVYIDDVVVKSANFQNHLVNLE